MYTLILYMIRNVWPVFFILVTFVFFYLYSLFLRGNTAVFDETTYNCLRCPRSPDPTVVWINRVYAQGVCRTFRGFLTKRQRWRRYAFENIRPKYMVCKEFTIEITQITAAVDAQMEKGLRMYNIHIIRESCMPTKNTNIVFLYLFYFF